MDIRKAILGLVSGGIATYLIIAGLRESFERLLKLQQEFPDGLDSGALWQANIVFLLLGLVVGITVVLGRRNILAIATPTILLSVYYIVIVLYLLDPFLDPPIVTISDWELVGPAIPIVVGAFLVEIAWQARGWWLQRNQDRVPVESQAS